MHNSAFETYSKNFLFTKTRSQLSGFLPLQTSHDFLNATLIASVINFYRPKYEKICGGNIGDFRRVAGGVQ
jgi:hypothetical protein